MLNDHLFLDAFVVLLSTAVSRCRNLSDRIPGCQFLGLVTSDENNYFEDAFTFLGVKRDEREAYEMEKVASDFVAIMREVRIDEYSCEYHGRR